MPGAPIIITPLGISAPISRNFLGFLRKSTISSSSCFASLAPATSLKVTFLLPSFGSIMRALLLPNERACIPAPLTERVKNQMIIPKNKSGNKNGANCPNQYENPVSRWTSILIFASCSAETPRLVRESDTEASVSRLASPMFRVSSRYATSSIAPRTIISLTSLFFTCPTTSEIVSCSGLAVVSVRYEKAAVIKISNNTVEAILFQKLPGPTGIFLPTFRSRSPAEFFFFISGSVFDSSSGVVGIIGMSSALFSGCNLFFSVSDIVLPLYRK